MTLSLARPEIASLRPYATAVQQAGTLRLNANEAANSPVVDGLNRYPPIKPDALQEKLADLFDVPASNLLATRGSSEAIDLLIRSFCRAYQDGIVVTSPGFEMYGVYARMQAAEVVNVPLQSAADFALDPDQLIAQCNESSKLIFLCSPNNPTGITLPLSVIQKILKARNGRSLVVVDEAYIEFSEYDSLVNQVEHHENLVVLRTLSKAWGLAGTRCGAVVAQPSIIELLGRMLPPYAFSTPATDSILASLSDDGQSTARELVTATIVERDRLSIALGELSCIDCVWPSSSNFLLVRFHSLADVQKSLSQHNILIRAFDDVVELRNCARITIGTKDENERLLDTLKLHADIYP